MVWATSLLFFALLGVGLYHQALSPNFPPHHLAHLPLDEEVVLSGRLYRPSRLAGERMRLYLAVEAWKSSQGWRPATGRLLITSPPLKAPPLGTPLFVRGKLREPQALKNPGSFNQPRHLAAEGIFRQMHLSDPTRLIFLSSEKAASLAEHLRGGIRSILQKMPPDIEAIYLSMLLGDQGKVTPEMRRNLSRTGTSHLLVINGLHLGAVAAVTFGLVFSLLRCFPWLLLRVNAIKLAILASAFPVIGYAHLAGGSPATQRAEIMVLVCLLLVFMGRFRDVWSALAIAASWILIWSPLLLFTASFQLSFAAVIGIFYLEPRLSIVKMWLSSLVRRWFNLQKDYPSSMVQQSVWDIMPLLTERDWESAFRLGLGIGLELLMVSFAASLATAPLVAYHFQVVSFFGFLVNLAAIPLVLMMALPLGELAVLGEALGLTSVAEILLKFGSQPLKMGYAVITWMAGLPGSGITVPSPTWFQVALMYGMIFLVFKMVHSLHIFAKHRQEENPPTGLWWLKNCWSCVGAGLIGVTLIFNLAWISWGTPQSCEITILDSRTGLDGILEAPGGKRVAVTAAWAIWPGWQGGGLGPLPSYLHWRQFRHLEAVLALNLNARNAQEMLMLVEQFKIGGFWWEGRRPEGKVVDLMNCLGETGVPGLSLTRMNPPTDFGGISLAYPSWDNGRGVALQVTYQGRQALVLPPLPRAVAEKLPWPGDVPLTVLVAPGDVPASVQSRLKPENLVVYGSGGPEAGSANTSRPPTYLTRQGAVTLTLTGKGASFRQWNP